MQSKSVTVSLDQTKGKYVSIFQFGSVVLFNLSDEECIQTLADIKRTGVFSPFAEDLQEKEEYEVWRIYKYGKYFFKSKCVFAIGCY